MVGSRMGPYQITVRGKGALKGYERFRKEWRECVLQLREILW